MMLPDAYTVLQERKGLVGWVRDKNRGRNYERKKRERGWGVLNTVRSVKESPIRQKKTFKKTCRLKISTIFAFLGF